MDFTRDDVEVFDSLASPARLQILASLARQPLSYSDLMRAVGMTKQSAAGKFSYHLKRLLSAELVKVNEKSKLYELTSRGKTALQHVENLKDALKSSDMMLVRRTESTVENFDRNKIVNVLISEAGVPPKLASHVASIAEERLEGLKVEYLTGPLIRELVNALLIDMGLEKYRHKLTRLGMPLYDFGRLVDKSSENGDFCSLVKTAAGSVIREYILLSVLPRDVGDAHLSGAIDLHAPELWLHGVDAKSYPLGAETLSAILDESLGVADEITLEVDEAGRKGLDNAATVLERLSSAKLMGGK
ncbi:MAG: helix-turn-helix domain-containing protein, partial [Nitrososphaerota archaeon]